MKIGILTYHRSQNYGALLQAVALKRTLNKLGHKVSFIDYWPAYHKDMYRILRNDNFRSVGILKKCKTILSVCLRLLPILKRKKKFNSFISSYILPYCSSLHSHYDVVICGSDQIWRKQSGLGNKFNPIYFGGGQIQTKSYVSYAASMGPINLNEEERSVLYNWLINFKYLSVRESSLKEALDSIGLSDVMQVLDPTLLLSKDEWEKLIPFRKDNKHKYLVVYDLLKDSFDMTAIRNFASRNKLKIRVLKGAVQSIIPNSKENQTAGPKEMLSLISGADYVFTSSYHGLAFAIIFAKPFFASFSKNSERAESLLNLINQRSRLLPPMASDIPTISNIDYENVQEILGSARKKSIEFLKKL